MKATSGEIMDVALLSDGKNSETKSANDKTYIAFENTLTNLYIILGIDL